jgi:cytidine deaminase
MPMTHPLDDADRALVLEAEAVVERNFDEPTYNHTVGAAIRSRAGKVYTGVNVDGIHGSCAEYIAIGAALTAGERDFDCVVAVYGKEAPHKVMPPCGNCRQMLFDYTPDCKVILQIDGVYQKVDLRDLLPYPCA